MTNLQVLNGGQANEELYLTSVEVAEMTEKRHDHLIRDIDNYVSVLGQNPKLGADKFFIESSYTAGTGKSYKQFLLTRRGCDMVANKMTGKRHDHLLRDIANYKGILEMSPKLGASNFFIESYYVEVLLTSKLSLAKFFIESNYQDSTGKTNKQYLLTRKGFDMVANKMTGKMHKNLIRDISNYIEVLSLSSTLSPANFFIESTYKDASGKENRSYLLTRRGCDMVANKMTGEKGILVLFNFRSLHLYSFF
ncbi:hypothetical protein COM55_06165 [Bacillus pseudomycoides]|uniref:Rha family transcriptional regulator n=1 Tax=Bacillus pseudomycoides TaxID=64104 RepID=UPI000BEFD98D|nr:Rha family transcriptional regulator [Bacillus pseudomycoides]PEK65577.1 hypothetical protein CN590_18095 [Bacillus pseudomycoides]PGE87360.1 hypothetical protein COM55_06165 [Bacillus pseudomycoides]